MKGRGTRKVFMVSVLDPGERPSVFAVLTPTPTGALNAVSLATGCEAARLEIVGVLSGSIGRNLKLSPNAPRLV